MLKFLKALIDDIDCHNEKDKEKYEFLCKYFNEESVYKCKHYNKLKKKLKKEVKKALK